MTTFFLIRHGANDVLRRAIAGRQSGVSLNAEGREQAGRLVDALRRHRIDRVLSSPLERARETAAPLAAARKLEVELVEELNEVDFGEWTGLSFEELKTLQEWQRWNSFRGGSRVPGGESMLEAQSRVIGLMARIRAAAPGAGVALFSHGDPIRSALLYYLGMPLDLIHRLQIDPGSVSVLDVTDWGAQVRLLNHVPLD